MIPIGNVDGWPGAVKVGGPMGASANGTGMHFGPTLAWTENWASAKSSPKSPAPPVRLRSSQHTVGGPPDGSPSELLVDTPTALRARPQTAPVNGRQEAVALQIDKPAAAPGQHSSGDSFAALMRKLGEEHTRQLEKLRKENREISAQLKSVLKATWAMGQDGWAGDVPHELTALRLTSMEQHSEKTVLREHTVELDEEDLEKQKQLKVQPAEKIDRPPQFFELRERWIAFMDGLLDPTAFGTMEAIVEVDEDGGEGRPSAARTSTTGKDLPTLNAAPDGCYGRLVVHPADNRLVAWDMFGMLLLAYDLIMIPISAFNPKENALMLFMGFFSLVFWTLDMILSFFTGYVEQGKPVMDPPRIIKHYMCRWFPLDLVIVVPDWIFTAVGMVDIGGISKATRLFRAFRLARALRLLRVVKLKRMLTMAKDYFHSECVFKVFNVMSAVSLLLFANHLLCAMWYAVGDIELQQNEANWIKGARIDKDELQYRYLTSLHWSVSHFTFADTDIRPRNSYERVFTILMLLIGMLFFATFTSYITVAMLSVSYTGRETSRQMWLLRRYLRQLKVSPRLKYRILRYAEFAEKRRKEFLSEDAVHLLDSLSDGLRTELRFETSLSCLLVHPLMGRCAAVGKLTMHTLANTALSYKSYAVKDAIFKPGIWSPNMYVVESGEVAYQHKVSSHSVRILSDTDWACEPALWVAWMTLGKLEASTDCKVVLCDVNSFCETISTDIQLLSIASKYATRFTEWINEEASNPDNLTDVFVGDDSRELVRGFLKDSLPDSSNRRSSFMGQLGQNLLGM